MTVAVNCESARNGGTRNHLRALLAAAPEGAYLPIFRGADGASWTSVEPPLVDIDAALPLRERLAWERQILPEALRELRPDVLLQPSNLAVAKRLRLPRVQILHNIAPLVDRVRDVAKDRLLARFLILRALTMRSMRTASGMVFLSETAAALAAERGWHGNSAVIRPGLDPVDPPVTRSGDVVVVAHLFRYKRVEDAVLAFDRSGIAQDGHRLRIFGGLYDGPYVDEVRQRISAARHREAIELMGPHPPPVVQDAVRHAAVVMQPSGCENAPQIVYEAVANRTPLVASDIPAHRELLAGPLHPVGGIDAAADLLRDTIRTGVAPEVRVPMRSWRETAVDIAEFCNACR